MPGYMSYGGNTVPYTGGTNPGFDPSSQFAGGGYVASDEEDRRRRAEAARRQRSQEDMIGRLMNGMMGGQRGGEREQSPSYGQFRQPGFYDGPMSSEMGGLGSSYKTHGNAPRYHEEIPMGGTPGVWAIRNDEIGGPRRDPFENMSPREWADSISSGIGRRFNRRYR